MMEFSDHQLINRIRQGDVTAFEELYRQFYIYLCLVAEHLVRNPADAEEIVSDVFVKLWNIRDKINITTSIKWYLVKAVRNTSLNYIEKNKANNNLTKGLSSADYEILSWDSDYPLGQLFQKEILDIFDKSITKLPDACKEIFLLSRAGDLNYDQIATKLGISVNTVKTQMKIALSRLRENLKDYLIILLLFMMK
jgi:RNA polymerase sigma-70 factor, ECF subfamily